MRQKLKLSVYNTEFYVNEKKKRVRCKMQFGIRGDIDTLLLVDMFSDRDCFEVMAEANTDPQDQFDIETGKKVARAKAESMAYKQLNNMLRRIALKTYYAMQDFMDFDIKADGVREHNDKYLAAF